MNGKIYVCRLSRNKAAEIGMEETDWESYRQNEECAGAIKKAINENYDGRKLKEGCAKEVIDRFGYERVNFVLAQNIRHMMHDGRISRRSKEWAEGISAPVSTGFKENWLIQIHPGLLDLFSRQTESETAGQAAWLTALYERGGNLHYEKGNYVFDRSHDDPFHGCLYAHSGEGQDR